MIYQPYHIIIGTKAQLVKMAPVMLALDRQKVSYKFVLTGQHQETMADLITSFSLKKPDITLYMQQESDTTRKLIRWLLKSSRNAWALRKEFKNSRGFLIHGDTLSTLWGAVFARIINVQVIHIEAGLRSFNILRPFPEEIIRRVVTSLSTVLFAAGDWAVHNIHPHRNRHIINTQYNTILDSLKLAINSKLNVKKTSFTPYIVVSIHRVENVMSDTSLTTVMNLVLMAAKKNSLKMVLHPITRRRLNETAWKEKLTCAGIELIPRMNYVNFIQLLNNSSGLITDGGSNQEEAAYLGLPTLLMRTETERNEGLGENIILSGLKQNVVESFVNNICVKHWQTNALPQISPSDIIAKYLKSRQIKAK